MPTVSTYGQRKVGTDAIPGARKTAGETPLSEGAGLEEARANKFEALAGLGHVALGAGLALGREQQRVRDDEQRRADEIAVLNAQNQLATWESKRVYDPQSGALSQKGRDSFGLPEAVGDEFHQVAGDIAAGLGTDRQRIAFARVQQERGQQLDLTLRRHVYGEMQHYEGQELQALVDNSRSAAIANATDPRRVGVELGRAVDAITTHAPRLGLGPEEIKKQIAGVTTATHVGVIEELLAQDQTKSAQVYFEETRSQINGDAIARVEKALDAGKTRGEAQKQADAILAAGGTFTEQREKARKIDDPEVRDSVMQRLEHEDTIRERDARDQNERVMRNVYDVVDRTHDVNKIPPATWATLSGGERASLHAYADRLAKGIAVETDLPTYYSLMTKAGTDPEKFATSNLLEYRAKLGDTEFKQLTGLQLSIRNGDRAKADKELSDFNIHNDIVNDTLSVYGVDPHAKPASAQGVAIANLRGMLRTRVQAMEQLTGKKPTPDDIRGTLDELLSTSVKVPGSWWNIFPGGAPFFDSDKRIIDLTIGDVPAGDRTQIEDALKRAGRPVSDQTVLNLFIEGKARRR